MRRSQRRARRRARPLAILLRFGYSFSGMDSQVVGWVNAHLLAPLGHQPSARLLRHARRTRCREESGASLPRSCSWAPGTCCHRGVIRWHLPVFYIGTFVLLAAVFGGLAGGQGWFAGGPVFQLLSGNLVLGAFYAAPDPVTSPLTNKGKCVFGIGLGVLTFFLRYLWIPR